MSRRRRVLRLFLLIGGTVVVLLLAMRFGLRVYSTARLERAQERFTSEAGPLELAAYAPPPVEEREENAAAWLRAGAAALILSDEETAFLADRVRSLASGWSAEDAERMEAVLRRHAPARELLQRAADLEASSYEIEYARAAEIEIPNFIPLLTAGRLLTTESDYRLARGDLEGARLALRTLERLVASLRRESLVITALVGSALERMWLGQVQALAAGTASPGVVAALAADLEHLERTAVPAKKPFAADGAFTSMNLSRVVSDFSGPGWFLVGSWHRPLASSLLLERFVLLVERLQEPLAEQDVAALEPRTTPVWVDWVGADMLADQLVPNFYDGLQKEQATLAARRLARAGLAVRLQGLTEGGYPQGLPEPVRSPFTGEEALYERQPDGSVVLALPEDAAAWETISAPRSPSGVAPPFRWQMPPVG